MRIPLVAHIAWGGDGRYWYNGGTLLWVSPLNSAQLARCEWILRANTRCEASPIWKSVCQLIWLQQYSGSAHLWWFIRLPSWRFSFHVNTLGHGIYPSCKIQISLNSQYSCYIITSNLCLNYIFIISSPLKNNNVMVNKCLKWNKNYGFLQIVSSVSLFTISYF